MTERARPWIRRLALLALAAAGLLLAVSQLSYARAQGLECPAEPDLSGTHARLMSRVEELRWRGCRPAAHEVVEAALARAEDEFGPLSLGVADTLDALVQSHYWLGQRSAIPLERARRALEIRTFVGDDRQAARAASRRNLGMVLSAQHEEESYIEAFDQFERARLIYLEAFGPESPELSELLTWYSELLDDWGSRGRSHAAHHPWISDLTDPETASGEAALGFVARFLSDIGDTGSGQLSTSALGEDPALVLAFRAVQIATETDTDGVLLGDTLNTLGNLLERRQLYDAQLKAYEGSFEHRQRAYPEGHPQMARSYHNRGEARLLVGRLGESWSDLRRGYEMRSTLIARGYTASLGSSLRLMGKWFYYSGDYQAAVTLYREAVGWLHSRYGPTNFRTVEGMMSLADAYAQLGELEEALAGYDEVCRRLEAAVSPDGARLAAVKLRQGALLSRRGDREAGRALLEEARTMQESLPELPLEQYTETLSGLAALADEGDTEAALRLRRSAVDTLGRYRGRHPAMVDLLLDVAETELRLGDDGSARQTASKIGEVLPELGPSAYLAHARLRYLRARLDTRARRFDAGLDDAIAAAGLYARHLAPAFRVLTPSAALRYARMNRDSLELSLSLLREVTPDDPRVHQVWEAVVRNRGLLVDELEQRYAWIRQGRSEQLVRALDELQRARRSVASIQVRVGRASTLDEHTRALRLAGARLETAERDFAAAAARERGRPSMGDELLTGVLGEIPTDAVLVAFVRYQDRSVATRPNGEDNAPASYGAFVSSSGGSDVRFVDFGAADVDTLVSDWRHELLDRGRPSSTMEHALRPVGSRLRSAIWDPLLPAFGDKKRVLVVPDGALFLLPLAALPARAEGQYLLEEGFETHRLVTERDLVKPAKRTPGPRRLLAVGGPDFNAAPVVAEARRSPESSEASAVSGHPVSSRDSSDDRSVVDDRGATLEFSWRQACQTPGSVLFSPLPDARDEIREVASLFRRGEGAGVEVTTLSSDRATESSFGALAPNHSVIHLATHAFFDLNCASRRTPRGVAELLVAGEERAPVSGLAFAGANRELTESPEDDGLLTVPEIASLDLSGVEWAVLSACETAIGPVASGEGVLGLARSFRVAGVDTLILSLWPVEDRATREWMSELYRARFLNNESTFVSLHRASASVLANRRRERRSTHPLLWASFVAVGDWR